jgi:hypothetical protein
MDRFWRYWWLGARLLVHVGIAWFVAGLPIALGQWWFAGPVEAGTPLGVGLMAAGVVYAVVAFPAVALPFPADTPTRPARAGRQVAVGWRPAESPAAPDRGGVG